MMFFITGKAMGAEGRKEDTIRRIGPALQVPQGLRLGKMDEIEASL
jgi:hypothetical protein